MTRSARVLSCLAAAAVTVAGLAVATAPAGQAAPDPEAAALGTLQADASGALTVRKDSDGVVTFAGVPAGVSLDDPGVTPSTGVVAAAAAHLARYGAAFGTTQPGTTLTEERAASTVAGDVVRYQQRVGGLPVLGGEYVVSLRPDRELSSILARTTRATAVSDALVAKASATETAQAAFQRSAGPGADAAVVSAARWVVDPTLIGAGPQLPVRTAWRFELTRGADERRMLLVDDQFGGVLMDVDLIDHVKNRIVCDNNNVQRASDVACVNSSPPVRVEDGPDAALAEANTAYVLGGAVYDNYLAFGGLDLTDLIGRVVDGGSTKALAQTVRWCYTGKTCPYANAFWNGSQMYYGTSYATADDVVGHEMTHGVTERSSGLFYWGQSGAMNESISDILGEIIDHRNVSPPGEAVTWTMGEDLPIGAIRSVQDPTLFGDPDKTSSANYVKEICTSGSCYPDEDGVHSNSGVGNKTFYLASQGGTFNGQTITGIDVGDPTLTKSAKLWLLTDQSLSSGSDYADEAVVLEQSCATLQTAGVMTAADCGAVHQATLATELRTTPTTNPQPNDATVSCPVATSVHVLLDSETGTPATKFTATSTWSRNGNPSWGQVAHSNPSAWSAYETAAAGAATLTAASAIPLPAGQASYLFFQHWRVLQTTTVGGAVDAGTVEVNGADAAALPWVNGPAQLINGTSNPANARLGFGADSRGYLASRLDLSSYAGQSVTPRFSFNTNNSYGGFPGWFVDDILVYTCDPVLVEIGNLTPPTITPQAAQQGGLLTAHPGTWVEPGTTSSWQWLRDGTPIASATSDTYTPVPADVGHALSVTETASKSGFADGSATSSPTDSVLGLLTTAVPTISGSAVVGQTLTADPGSWGPAPVALAYQWSRDGSPVPGATAATYPLTAGDLGASMSVEVTGSKAGYVDGSETSLPTDAVLGLLTTAVPTVSGSAVVGQTLTADPGTWGPAPVVLAYQWSRDGSPVPGATAATYPLTAGDLGASMSVEVTGTKTGYVTASQASGPVGPVTAAPPPPVLAVTAGAPTVTGKAVVGKKLTAHAGSWAPAGVTLAYQWLRNGTPIAGATGSTYKLTKKDKGKKISVRVTGSKSGLSPASATSAQTKKVKPKKKKQHHRVAALPARLAQLLG